MRCSTVSALLNVMLPFIITRVTSIGRFVVLNTIHSLGAYLLRRTDSIVLWCARRPSRKSQCPGTVVLLFCISGERCEFAIQFSIPPPVTISDIIQKLPRWIIYLFPSGFYLWNFEFIHLNALRPHGASHLVPCTTSAVRAAYRGEICLRS